MKLGWFTGFDVDAIGASPKLIAISNETRNAFPVCRLLSVQREFCHTRQTKPFGNASQRFVMPDTIRLVIAWTCAAVFVATAIITILALLGVIKLPDPKYLNRLFTIIIVAVVGTCASFFKDFLKVPDSAGNQPVADTSSAGGAKPPSNPTNPAASGLAANRPGFVAPKPTNAPGPVAVAPAPTNVPGSSTPKPPNLRPALVLTNLATLVSEKGWVGFKNSGGYVAKFYVNWKEDGQAKSWASGNKAVGYSGVVSLTGNVNEVTIDAQANTGFGWATIFRLGFTNGPPNKTYVVSGTTLNRRWTTDDRTP